MKSVVVYRDNTEDARAVQEFLRDFERQTGKTLEVLDPDTSAGASFCRTYDIVEYPTIVAVDSNGTLLQVWRGMPLPRMTEVSYYVE